MYQNFAKLKKEKNMTAYAIAKRTGIPESTFSDWKKGKSSPKLDKLIKIANCLGVPLEELIGQETTLNKEAKV